MQNIHNGYRGLSLLFDLNWDRIMYLLVIAVALTIGAFFGAI